MTFDESAEAQVAIEEYAEPVMPIELVCKDPNIIENFRKFDLVLNEYGNLSEIPGEGESAERMRVYDEVARLSRELEHYLNAPPLVRQCHLFVALFAQGLSLFWCRQMRTATGAFIIIGMVIAGASFGIGFGQAVGNKLMIQLAMNAGVRPRPYGWYSGGYANCFNSRYPSYFGSWW